ncbi:MAG: glycosyltransferase [Candidatus Hydrogenedentes bacterium]|nr:glycosyltransferase [Candidatus Hydrogenedentota bacterium]
MNDRVTAPRQKTVLPTNVPPAPEELWKRKYESFGLVFARFLALLTIIAAPITGSAILATLAIVAFVLQILTNQVRRSMFVRNLYGLPCLRPDQPVAPDPAAWPGVSFISPARNEEAGIEVAARSVAALDYPDIEVIYVDDHSTDSTPAILDRLAAEFPRLRVLHDPPSQEGWLGKANAVWHGLADSDASKPWVVLADADVVFEPGALRQAIALAVANKLDFLTCVAYIDNGSLGEELYMPCAWAGIIQGSHYNRLNEPRTPAIGIGAFTLVKRSIYLSSGGHAAIYDRHPEDTLLAALVRKHGGNMGVCWTPSMIRVRIYRGFNQLQQFIVRKIRMQSEDRIARMGNRVVYLLIQDVLPLPMFVAACVRQIAIGDFSFSMTFYAIMALITYLTNVGAFEKFRHIARMRRYLEWFHPIGGLLRIYFYIVAALQVAARRGMEWRGRDYTHR